MAKQTKTKQGESVTIRLKPDHGNRRLDVKKALELWLEHGLTYREIAKQLDTTAATVCRQLEPYKHLALDRVDTFKALEPKLLADLSERLLLSVTDEDIKKANIRDRLTIYGILFDKRRLASGQSTQNISMFSHLVDLACES